MSKFLADSLFLFLINKKKTKYSGKFSKIREEFFSKNKKNDGKRQKNLAGTLFLKKNKIKAKFQNQCLLQ